MVHLTVAIARFVEALFWAIFRASGWVALLVVGVAAAGALVFTLIRSLWRRR